MDNTTRHTAPIDLVSPGHLIASLPGILGYYPHESTVLIGFHAHPSAPEVYSLGPVVRADISRTAAMVRACELPPLVDCDIVLALIITRTPYSDTMNDAVDILFAVVGDDGEPVIDACWQLSEIAAGSSYSMVFGPSGGSFVTDTGERLPGWEHGMIASVIDSPTMAPLVGHGGLPSLTRDEAVAYFDRLTESSAITALAARAYSLADDYLKKKPATTGASLAGAFAAVERAASVLEDVAPRALAAEGPREGVRDVFDSDDDILAVATVLARSALRDALVVPALEAPEEFATGLLAIARSFSGVIRANALSLWAIIATSQTLSAKAYPALAAVIDDLPGHTLAEALLAGMRFGNHDALIGAVEAGSHLQREELQRIAQAAG